MSALALQLFGPLALRRQSPGSSSAQISLFPRLQSTDAYLVQSGGQARVFSSSRHKPMINSLYPFQIYTFDPLTVRVEIRVV